MLDRPEYLYPDAATGPYRLRLSIDLVNGRPAIVGVEMWGIEPPADDLAWRRGFGAEPGGDPANLRTRDIPDTPITAAAVRLKLGELLDRWVKKQQAQGRAVVALGADALKVSEFLAPLSPGPKKRGRRPMPDSLLKLVLTEYRRAYEAGDRFPAQAVGHYLREVTGRPELKDATVRKWILRTRERYPDQMPPAPVRAPRQPKEES